jgi:tight adherence protein B
MRRLRPVLLALVVAVLATGAAQAASPEESIKIASVPSKFPERTFVVTLPKEVALRPGLVTVRENGEVAPNVAVTPMGGATGGDFGAVLLIDASESMEGAPLEGAMNAARAFTERRKPNQKLSVVTYNATTNTLLPFTTDGALIRAAMSETPSVAYWTRMYDAIEEVVALIRSEKVDYSAIVLLSDGQELGSSTTLEAATAAARNAGVRIFTVALMSRYFDSTTLKSLAKRTGGDYFEASSPNALVGIYRKLGTQLANEYLVQYRSYAGPGAPVHVHVSVAGIEGDGLAQYRAPRLTDAAAPSAAIHRSLFDRWVQSKMTMFILVLLIATLLTLTVTTLIGPKESGVRKRLGAFVAVASADNGRRQTAVLSEKLLEGTERSLRSTRWWTRLRAELEIAEIAMPAEQIVVLTALGTILVAWVLSVVMSTTFALLGLLTPYFVRMYIKFRAERQRRAFADQLPDNLQVLASALRAGHSLVGALSVVVDDAPQPSRREFRQIVADEQLGVPLEEALATVGLRMRSTDLEQVALVAALQRETGGNSAEVLDRVAETVRERAALRRLVRTLTAQGRMARWIVSALPVALLLVISIINPAYSRPLFDRTAGQIILFIAAVMVISGSLVIRRIVNIRV